jgi:anti-sigma regulatory factor (Ser/Thr protein kinase)
VGDALPAFDGLALAAARLPGAGAGDPVGAGWYDVAATDDGHVVSIAMGDTGRASAAAVEPVRRALAGMRRERHSPAAGLAQLDHAVRQGPDSLRTTALFVTLDLTHGVLRWSRAGHRPPLIVGPGDARYLVGGGAGPLGGPRAERFAEAHDRITAGSTVVLVADGADAHPDALDDLATAVAQHHELTPEALAAALGDRSVLSPAESGRTLLIARVMPLPLEERRSAEPRQLAAVRRTVRAWSALAALSDDCSADLQLLLSEAASNSVEHAYRGSEVGEFAYEVRRRANGGVRVAVQDFGRWRPPPADPGYRGRGLALIKNLAEEVTLDVGDTGTRVAFTVPAGPPHHGTEELRR